MLYVYFVLDYKHSHLIINIFKIEGRTAKHLKKHYFYNNICCSEIFSKEHKRRA